MSADALRALFSGCEKLLEEYPDITEFMVNEDGVVWVERSGIQTETTVHYTEENLNLMFRLLAGYSKTVVNEDRPDLAAKLPFFRGARFQGVIQPNVRSPIFSIRVPSLKKWTISELEKTGMLNEEQADFLLESVKKRANILVVGGTGSGKTSLANAILGRVTGDRIIVIEDQQEIQTNSRNTSYLLTTPNLSLSQCVKVTLRLNPTRIVIGEIRDGETTMEVIIAWNSGIKGGIATVHANSAMGGLNKLIDLGKTVGKNISMETLREAIDVLVYVEKEETKGGKILRKVKEIINLKAANSLQGIE